MSKKDRKNFQDKSKTTQGKDTALPAQAVVPIDPKYLSWKWYAKILVGCLGFSTILFFAFVTIMKTISRHYTDEGIAMYRQALVLRAVDTRDVDTIAGELSSLDAIADIEKLKLVLLRDVAYNRAPVTEVTKNWLKEQDEKYAVLQGHLKELTLEDNITSKIRDKTVAKVGGIRECVQQVLKNIDAEDKDRLQKLVVRMVREIGTYSWYSQIAAGLFSWPAAFDAAERSFFEALRFWQKNQEAAYWWGKTLDEVAIQDVAAEKKIMAIKFNPKSILSDTIVVEFKTEYDASPTSPRAIYNYAFALYRKGRAEEALPLYKKVYAMDPEMNTFEGFLAKRRIDIIERKIDMRWYKTDDF